MNNAFTISLYSFVEMNRDNLGTAVFCDFMVTVWTQEKLFVGELWVSLSTYRKTEITSRMIETSDMFPIVPFKEFKLILWSY